MSDARSDRARYDDGEEVLCWTCAAPVKKPTQVSFDEHLRVRHLSCVPLLLKCDGTHGDLSDAVREVSRRDATFWNPNKELCYCDDCSEGLLRLEMISTMPPEIRAGVSKRQKREG